jgi:hypothetical protein
MTSANIANRLYNCQAIRLNAAAAPTADMPPERRRSHRPSLPSNHRPPVAYNRTVEFSPELRDRVIAGDITVSFRLWQRPRVRVGGMYAVRDVHIQVDAIDPIPFYAISAADVRRAGEPDRETLRRRAAHAGPIADDTVLYRVEFHAV